jgi:putative tryptophan/tyrosine transport system substrate-binding protein
MNRREFIAGLGGPAAWPLTARAQQRERMRRVGMLMAFSEAVPKSRALRDAFIWGLTQSGWREGENIQIEQRWTGANIDLTRRFAKELVAFQPDVLFANTTPATGALARETREIPIVFTVVSDPIGAGLVTSLSRPGGNITGFINIEAATAGKSLGLLKEIAPTIKRAAIMFNPDTAPGGGKYFLPAFEVAARSLGLEPISMEVRSDAEIEAAIGGLKDQHAGLVLNSDSFLFVHQATIILSTMRNSVPSIGDVDGMLLAGGLMYYGPDYIDMFHRAAGHVNRILRGESPSALPVEFPTKWTLLINLKTAKTLGLEVPPTLLVLADEVIE